MGIERGRKEKGYELRVENGKRIEIKGNWVINKKEKIIW